MQSNEILMVVDSVSNEKGLTKEVIFNAVEIALASASQRHFHEDAELNVNIDKILVNIQLTEAGLWLIQRTFIFIKRPM